MEKDNQIRNQELTIQQICQIKHHKTDAKELAQKICKLHMDCGLSEKDSVSAAIVSVKYALDSGLYPFTKSLNQRTHNYLRYFNYLTYNIS